MELSKLISKFLLYTVSTLSIIYILLLILITSKELLKDFNSYI